MKKRKKLVPGAMAGAALCTLVFACSSSSSSSPNNAAPGPGLTEVTEAPYPICTTLEQGSYVTANGGSYPVPATTSCKPAGTPTAGPADMHCVGVPPQTVNGASCSVEDAGAMLTADAGDDDGGDGGDGDAAAGEDAGSAPAPGPCGENGPDYGATMYGTEGDDDDCKYHVSYTATPICENNGTYFVVTANYLTRNGAPLTGASTFAELCLNSTLPHPTPAIDGRPGPNGGDQLVVEGPPGTYTVGPVQFDAPGDWTVRFHFNEFCCDVTDDSPHGHAAFHITVP